MKQGGKDLTKGNEAKVILKFALPMMVGNIFQQLYNVTDAAIVGKFVGTRALSATGISFPILFMLSSMIIGFAIGGTILISQYYGAGKYKDVKKTADTLQIIMVGLALIISIVGIAFSKEIFVLLNFPPDNMDMAVSYFEILMSGNIAIFGYNSLAATLRGLGDSQTPVKFLILSSIVNIILDIVLVVFFNYGVNGAAWATVISYFMAYISDILYLNARHKMIRIDFSMRFDKNIFKKIIQLGLPSSAQMVLVSSGNLLFFSIVNLFGTGVIAAYTAVSRINSFATMPSMFFSSALTAFVGQNTGAGKFKRIRRGLYATMMIVGIISLFFTAIALLMPNFLMKLFTNDYQVIATGVDYFRKVSPFYIVFAMMFSYNALYRGTGNTLVPMYIAFVALWLVRFPAAILLALNLSFNPFQLIPVDFSRLWWSEPIGWSTGLILATSYYLSNKWLIQARKKATKMQAGHIISGKN